MMNKIPDKHSTFTLHPPDIHAHELVLRWDLTPESSLFAQHQCFLRFPECIDLNTLPDGFIERITLLLLHPFWPILSPCSIKLPFQLPQGELECWQRLCSLQWDTLQAHVNRDEPLALHWSSTGPNISASPQPITGSGCAAAFSGGKDSLFQAGFLSSQSEHPLLVSTVSEKGTVHKRKVEVDQKISEWPHVTLLEVETNFRAIYHNFYPIEKGWVPAVNELNDVLLYAANLLTVAAAKDIPNTFVASENEVQASVQISGRWVQHPHAMYSVATLKIVEALFAPYAMTLSSLTAPLMSTQIQKTLWKKWPEVRGLQTSCWRMSRDEDLCNECRDCLKAALDTLAAGQDPREMGADLVKNLAATQDWEPVLSPAGETPNDITRSNLHQQTILSLCDLSRLRLLTHLLQLRPGGPLHKDFREAWKNAMRLKARGQGLDHTRLSYYADQYLAFVDDHHREALNVFLEGEFKPGGPTNAGNQYSKNTFDMIAWATESLPS